MPLEYLIRGTVLSYLQVIGQNMDVKIQDVDSANSIVLVYAFLHFEMYNLCILQAHFMKFC